MFKKFFLILFLGCIVSAILAVAAGGWAYYHYVVTNPGEEIKQHNIEKILAMESPVYYRDGQTKIGVFFEDAHRQYLTYQQIPGDFINAIIAAEDNTFFTHYGINPVGIARAMISNIKAGRVVQGGSTITQQTAKNLFKRKDRSLRSKLKELLYALRLEYHYPKEKILEFYINQFYVSGNGHGLGVAARYYFDKPARELTLLECAFIAGSVKRPNAYNPFIKKSEKEAARARDLAGQRADYVLGQMYRLGMVDTQRYRETLTREINFKRGRMFFALNTLMDLVKDALGAPEVEEALSLHGIDNISTSGIRVFTTVDKNLQDKGCYSLRKQLSRLDVRLRGYDPEALRRQYPDLDKTGPRDLRTGEFLFGEIIAIDQAAPMVRVSFKKGHKVVSSGRIDKAGLKTLVSDLAKWRKNRWTESSPRDLIDFVGRLKIGDPVFVSIREKDPLANEILLDLEKYPEIQGGLLVLQNGRIRAMVGGMENRFYNRAIAAQRPMGSAIKPLVYGAALQLAWNNTDLLNNERNLFLYQNQAYFPRPDHNSPHNKVSMSWAGVKSENLATIWLLHHLCDRLTPAQLREVTDRLDLNRRQDESYGNYMRRLRDQQGILVDRKALLRAAFHLAVSALEPDLIFAGNIDELEQLRKLHFGINFENYYREIETLREADYEELSPNRKLRVDKEIELRRRLLDRNYLRLRQLLNELRRLAAGETGVIAAPDIPVGPGIMLKSNIRMQRDTLEETEPVPLGRLYRDWTSGALLYASSRPTDGFWEQLDRSAASSLLMALAEKDPELFRESVRLEGGFSIATLETLTEYLLKEYNRLSALPAYSFEVLRTVPDFRILAGLRYLVALSRELGIRSRLDPVLSFPLGSNVITLFEVARIYEGLGTGKASGFADENAPGSLAIIDRIEDSDGSLIFRPERVNKRVFDPKTTLAVDSILRNVVRFGTGRFADANVRLHSIEAEVEAQLAQLDLHVPVLGKTGTANEFTNAAFVGLVPNVAADASGMTLANGYVIAAYVGFDDNSPMERTNTHITGASGALPIWTGMANAILLEMNVGEKFDLIDMLFTASASARPTIPLLEPDLGQIEVRVNRADGVFQPATPLPGETMAAGDATITTFGRITANGELEPERHFRPYWNSMTP
ncbi:MAG: transglycosylase domain-containing protein [Desulfobacterales bacterium]|nr:transglycosylase domain-containing protein [Desulfobacterales bacterium]